MTQTSLSTKNVVHSIHKFTQITPTRMRAAQVLAPRATAHIPNYAYADLRLAAARSVNLVAPPQRPRLDAALTWRPRPNAYTREFPKLTCVGTGPRPRRVCRQWGFWAQALVFWSVGIGVFVVATLGRVDPRRTLATGRGVGARPRVSRQFKSRSLAIGQLDDLVRYDI